MIADTIVMHARECMGTPFLHQGRVAGIGLDCAGVLEHILRRMGLPYQDERGYGRNPFEGMLLKSLMSQQSLRRKPISETAAGDVLLMRFGAEPQHIAICAGETIIHSYSQIGRVVEHGLDFKWKRRITHVFEVVE